jgi:hypothetical protein
MLLQIHLPLTSNWPAWLWGSSFSLDPQSSARRWESDQSQPILRVAARTLTGTLGYPHESGGNLVFFLSDSLAKLARTCTWQRTVHESHPTWWEQSFVIPADSMSWLRFQRDSNSTPALPWINNYLYSCVKYLWEIHRHWGVSQLIQYYPCDVEWFKTLPNHYQNLFRNLSCSACEIIPTHCQIPNTFRRNSPFHLFQSSQISQLFSHHQMAVVEQSRTRQLIVLMVSFSQILNSASPKRSDSRIRCKL